jgi:hypothetical protein
MRIVSAVKRRREETMISRSILALVGAIGVFAVNASFVQAAPYMIVGIDEKQHNDNGKTILSLPGKDSV